MSDYRIMPLGPDEAQERKPALIEVYRSAFSGPPYNRDDVDAATFADTLHRHSQRVGFRSLAALDDNDLVGFIYGYRTAMGQWWHDIVASHMTPEQREAWLDDAFELVELAVRTDRQGQGIGGRLHDTLIASLPHRRAVLSTHRSETPAMQLYRRRGWVMLVPEIYFPGTPEPYVIMGLDIPGNEAQG